MYASLLANEPPRTRLDRLRAQRAVAGRARQHDGHRALPQGGHGPEQPVDRQERTVVRGGRRHHQAAVHDGRQVAGRDDVDVPRPKRLEVLAHERQGRGHRAVRRHRRIHGDDGTRRSDTHG